MTHDDLTQRRRAVYTGLSPFLKSDDLIRAMVLWEDCYSNRPMFSARFFLADVQKTTQCTAAVKDMLLKLVASMNQSATTLLPDPAPAMRLFRLRNRPAAPQQLPVEIEAFIALVNSWLGLIDKANGYHIVRFVARSVERSKLPRELCADVSSWLDNRNHRFKTREVKVRDLRHIINLLYVACCEYLGPVKTDQILSKALHLPDTTGRPELRDALNNLL